MTYTFSRVFPPLLKDDLDLLGIDPDLLKQPVGSDAAWEEVVDTYHEESLRKLGLDGDTAIDDGPDNGSVDMRGGWGTIAQKWYTRTITHYTLKRGYQWANSLNVHLDPGQKLTTTVVHGYDRTEADKFEKTMSIGLSAGVPFAGLKADVRLALKINHDVTQQWHTSTTDQITKEYPGGHWYAAWHLFDVITVTKSTQNQILDVNKQLVQTLPPVTEDAQVASAVGYFEDAFPPLT